MGWMHDHLGIAVDADERTIKRAYAAKLRMTRPDEDPEGFQQLNEAYQQALRITAGQDAHRVEIREARTPEDDNGHDASHARIDRDTASWRPVADRPAPRTPRPMPLPSARALPPLQAIDASTSRFDADGPGEPNPDPNEAQLRYYDFNAFYESVEIRIHGSHPPDFAEWLAEHPDLRDARLKRWIGMRLPRFLKARPTLPTAHVEALVQCFGFGAMGAGTADQRTGFDPGVFLDMLEIEAHRSSPSQFRQSLENHPDLYDVALKQRLTMPVLRFIESTPDLPASHVQALIAFFGLDKVDAHSIHVRVQAILTRTAPEVAFQQSAAQRNQSRYVPPIWPIIFLVIVLSRCASGNF